MISKYMDDYKNQDILNKYDIRFEKPYIKDFLLYTLFELIEPYGKTILDCPCSTGYITDILIKKGAKFVIGCDIVKEQIEYAKKRLSNNGISENKYKLLDYDAKIPQIIYKEVDIAIVIHLFCFANDFKEMIDIGKFIYMNLKSGGKLYTYHCTPIREGKDKLYEELYNSTIIEKRENQNKLGEFIVTKDNGFTLPRNMYKNEVVIKALKLVGFREIKMHKFVISPDCINKEEVELNHDVCDYYYIEAVK